MGFNMQSEKFLSNGSKTLVVATCTHAHPDHENERANLLGKLVADVKPDAFIHLGDHADLASLCSYEKGKKEFQGRTYKADIDSHLDFQERLFYEIKRPKKKLPLTIGLVGNHDQRINKAVSMQPELEDWISLDDLQLDSYYNVVVPYNGSTPGIVSVCGINMAHYLVSGVMGKPLSGENPATALLSKHYNSCVVGHSHLLDYSVRTRTDGNKLMAMHVGCMTDYKPSWAGSSSNFWFPGCVILRNAEAGQFEPQVVSMDALRKEYG